VLVLTGERRGESTARSKYDEVVPHGSTNKKRRVDQWRSVIDWTEEDVWNVLERWRIRPHPAYQLGWGRVSCMACIFGDKNQWASVRHIAPNTFDRIVQLEVDFDHTIDSKLSVLQLADKGESFINGSPKSLVDLALGKRYDVSQVFVPDDEEWAIPKGAYKQCGGPI
jgi:3'-phosphoadenosine 5'-phosphosulfate sulfotransferase (PAPS reductase)/FAD synthetase